MEGFNVQAQGRAVTVWSAPNYCGQYKNKATVLRIDNRNGENKAEFVPFGPEKEKGEVGEEGGETTSSSPSPSPPPQPNLKYFID